MRELKDKILEALVSALPITLIVYVMAMTPLFEFSRVELVTFTVGAILLVLSLLASLVAALSYDLSGDGKTNVWDLQLALNQGKDILPVMSIIGTDSNSQIHPSVLDDADIIA